MSCSKELCELSLSHDELMLKELERRDGIYSFIFHELESPKDELADASKAEQDAESACAVASNPKRKSPTAFPRADINSDTLLQPQQQLPQHATAICTPTAIASRLIASISTMSASGGTASLVTTSASTSGSATSISFSSAGAGVSSSLSSALSSYQEYLKAWHPPPSLVYDNPKLYAYMANCGFRVRVPTPRFSHISVPLVRNRRHALKESAEYKRCDMVSSGIFKIPDLRPLFPHDPDVHAPFHGDSGEEPSAALLK